MRRRKPLQPDTLPFLAVLLGAMGSLILILMIFDHRARKAAQQKTYQAEAEQQRLHRDQQHHPVAGDEAERKARLAAFVQKQSEIRALESQLEQKQSAVSQQIGETERKIAEEEQRRQQTEAQLRAEQQRLQQALREAQERQQGLHHNDSATKQTQSQIQKLAADLAQAEEALKRLLEQKLRDEQTWSIVPYVGKRGQNQRPLYVECDSHGFTFHPDKLTLLGIDAVTNRVRQEIEARTTQARKDRPGREVYWMLLVRPDGIENYYRFQAATRGLAVAFGYELIDGEWALEFPEPPNDPVTVTPQSPRPVRVASDNALSQGSRSGTGSPATVLPPIPSEGGSPNRISALAPGTPGARGASSSQGENPLSPDPSPLSTGERGALNSLAPGTPGARVGERGDQRPGSEPAPPPMPGGTGPQSAPGGQPSPEGKEGSPSAGQAQGTGSEGEPGSSEKGGTVDGLPGPKKPKVLKPARVGPEPDWIIEVVCHGSRVSVPGGRMQYTLDELNGNSGVLAERIAKWIADRQATLRPGEPPYRPQIHFIVRPDGQRTFHLVYPTLERLHVPMRTVLHQDDGE